MINYQDMDSREENTDFGMKIEYSEELCNEDGVFRRQDRKRASVMSG